MTSGAFRCSDVSDQDPFSPHEKQRLACLAQSVSCNAGLAQALSSATLEGAVAGFEATSKAVALVNAFGQVVKMNAAAESLLRGEVTVIDRQIVGTDRNATNLIKKTIEALAVGRAVAGPIPIVFARTLKRPILAYPVRLDRTASYFFTNCKVAIILVDMDQPAKTHECELRTVFGMTPSEARLASRLMHGNALDEIADELGITKETARNHLKSIFEKAGVNRQSLALFARLSGPKR